MFSSLQTKIKQMVQSQMNSHNVLNEFGTYTKEIIKYRSAFISTPETQIDLFN